MSLKFLNSHYEYKLYHQNYIIVFLGLLVVCLINSETFDYLEY